ncbi:MAG: hypothetical protein RLZZ367_2411, partial [Bacteroidota bacterium]
MFGLPSGKLFHVVGFKVRSVFKRCFMILP